MQVFYSNQGFGDVPIPAMALVSGQNTMVQERVFGQRLSELSDEEISNLPTHIIHELINLITCSLEAFRKRGILKDFPDLPGYNFDLPTLQRLSYALQARRSINILIGNTMQNGEQQHVHFVDPDLYYSSCRSPVTMSTATIMKHLSMFPNARKFRNQLQKILDLNISVNSSK